MTTTIQVSDATKQVLEMLKKKEQAETYDQVIQHLVSTHVPKSMFGAFKGIRWKKQDRMKFHGE